MLLDRYDEKSTMEMAARSDLRLNGSVHPSCAPGVLSLLRENHFPFFAGDPRNSPRSERNRAIPVPSTSSYSARVSGHFPAHLRASYEESCHNCIGEGGKGGDSDTNFRRSDIADIEKRGISAAKFPSRLFLRRDVNKDRRYFSSLSI